MFITSHLCACSGLHHEGIFRVSGSQVEVNDIKNAFERGESVWSNTRWACVCPFHIRPALLKAHCVSGEDPLAGDQNDHDMDSIAGVLKLYFRGLENALFPKEVFHDLMSCVCECPLYFLHPQYTCVLQTRLDNGGAFELITCCCFFPAMESLQERAVHIRKVLLSLPSNTLVIMRYLFAFLNQWVLLARFLPNSSLFFCLSGILTQEKGCKVI